MIDALVLFETHSVDRCHCQADYRKGGAGQGDRFDCGWNGDHGSNSVGGITRDCLVHADPAAEQELDPIKEKREANPAERHGNQDASYGIELPVFDRCDGRCGEERQRRQFTPGSPAPPPRPVDRQHRIARRVRSKPPQRQRNTSTDNRGRRCQEYTPLNATAYTAGDVRAKLLTVDGSGSGLDADLLDGQDSGWYTDITARLGYTPLNANTYTAADVRAKLLTVDGSGSGLDADLLDGRNSDQFVGFGLVQTGSLAWGAPQSSNQSFGGLELRESGLVGSAYTHMSYAPGINFHWSQRTAGRFLMDAEGQFVLTGANDIATERRSLILAGLQANQPVQISHQNALLLHPGVRSRAGRSSADHDVFDQRGKLVVFDNVIRCCRMSTKAGCTRSAPRHRARSSTTARSR